MSHYVERFHAAVSVLAGHGHVKQRLMRAYEENLGDIRPDELPVSVRQAFADLKHQMNCVAPLNGEGPICASVRKMSVADASECASVVVALFGEISRLGDNAQAHLPFEGQDRPVPPFLVKSS